MSPAWTLENRVAIVTGGSRGIGFAIADALLARGARVVISGTNAAHLDAALPRLSAHHQPVEAVRADVRRPDEVGALVSKTVDTFGGLDILVNNAGIGRFVEASDMTIDEWRETIETNLSGVFYCCSAAIPHLKRRGGGWIVNVSSLAGKNSFPGGSAYCASKAGLNAFSEALMQEVRHDGIRVCYVMPGSVSTEFGGPPRADDSWKLTPEDVALAVVDVLGHDARSLPSRIEIRPSRPERR